MQSFPSAPVISASPKSDQLSAFEVHGIEAKNRKKLHRERANLSGFTNTIKQVERVREQFIDQMQRNR